jgi:hypothetical protein
MVMSESQMHVISLVFTLRDYSTMTKQTNGINNVRDARKDGKSKHIAWEYTVQ